MTDKLTCAQVRAERAARLAKIQKHERAIAALGDVCLHDERRTERDYQDPKPYEKCLGCGRSFT